MSQRSSHNPSQGAAEGPASTQALVSGYLSKLAKSGKGQDPAMIHDMLADAERHLVEAVQRGVPVMRAIEEYGEPSVVAAAYARMGDMGVRSDTAGASRSEATRSEGSSQTNAGVPAGVVAAAASTRTGLLERLSSLPVLGVWFDRWAWGSTLFWVVGLVPAILYFTLIVTGVSLSLGLLPMLIGPMVLVGLLGLTRGLALLHGRLIETLVGVRMPRRTAPVAGMISSNGSSNWVVRQLLRIWLWLRDGRSWLAMLLLVVNLPVAITGFTIAVTLLSLAFAFAATPFASIFAEVGGMTEGAQLMNLGVWKVTVGPGGVVEMPRFAYVLGPILGLLLMTLALWVMKGLGVVYGQGVKAIQVSRPVFDEVV